MANDEKEGLFPVYLPKPMREYEDREEHETQISQNENMLNQNFEKIVNRMTVLESTISALQASGSKAGTAS